MTAAERSTLGGYVTMLNEVIDVWSVWADPAVAPRTGSLAAEEFRAVRGERAVEGFWDEDPLRMAYAIAIQCYGAALEQARTMVALMTGNFSVVPVLVLARSLLEAASQAWWLLEPDIGHKRRVQRLQALRFRSAVEGERGAKADGATAREYSHYTETTEAVVELCKALGLTVPVRDNNVFACGDERLPTASQRVRTMFSELADIPSLYNRYSGASHAELFALRLGFEMFSTVHPEMHWRPIVNVEEFKGAVAVVVGGLSPAGARMSKLFGFDMPSRKPSG